MWGDRQGKETCKPVDKHVSEFEFVSWQCESCLCTFLPVWLDLIKEPMDEFETNPTSIQQGRPSGVLPGGTATKQLSAVQAHGYATPAIIRPRSSDDARWRPACPLLPLSLLKDITAQTWRWKEARSKKNETGGIEKEGEECLYKVLQNWEHQKGQGVMLRVLTHADMVKMGPLHQDTVQSWWSSKLR